MLRISLFHIIILLLAISLVGFTGFMSDSFKYSEKSLLTLPAEMVIDTVSPQSKDTEDHVGEAVTEETEGKAFEVDISIGSPIVPQENTAIAPPLPPIPPLEQSPNDQQILSSEETQTLSFTEINTDVRNAVVNILCTTRGSGPLNPISGSGVFIDSRGVILTNAHIAQYLLLKNYPSPDSVECIIRTESPATPAYHVAPLYISPAWIEENSENLRQESPKGTGEADFALLVVTSSATRKVLPTTFPFLPIMIDDSRLRLNDPVLLAAYPAGFLGGITIQKDLYMSSAITSIQELFTFNERTLDLISIGGSVVAQSGSSGGAVVNGKGDLIGIIVTSSTGTTTEERDLRAITLSHVTRSLSRQSNMSLEELLLKNLTTQQEQFSLNMAPELLHTLTSVFE